MDIVTIPLNSDNYGYLLIDQLTRECAIVDVSGQPHEVLRVIKEAYPPVKVTTILTTHKHWDHAGGNNQMKAIFPDIEILGSKQDDVEGCTKYVEDNEIISFGNDIKIQCLLTPGHTMGHITYHVTQASRSVIFTGDCLFIGGAGKFFEGTGIDMYHSLYEKLASLDPETEIYCGHEYTLSNYKFAVFIDKNNQHLNIENLRAQELRANGLPTVPSTISKELLTNPFLRVNETSIKEAVDVGDDPIAILTAVREAKNNFK